AAHGQGRLCGGGARSSGGGCADSQRDQRDSRNQRSRRVGLHVDPAHGRRDANGRRSLHDAVRTYPIGAQETPGQMGAGSRCEYADSSHFLAFLPRVADAKGARGRVTTGGACWSEAANTAQRRGCTAGTVPPKNAIVRLVTVGRIFSSGYWACSPGAAIGVALDSSGANARAADPLARHSLTLQANSV